MGRRPAHPEQRVTRIPKVHIHVESHHRVLDCLTYIYEVEGRVHLVFENGTHTSHSPVIASLAGHKATCTCFMFTAGPTSVT